MKRALAVLLILCAAAVPLRARREGPSHRERAAWAAQAQDLYRAKKYAAAAELYDKALAGAGEGDLVRWLPQQGLAYEAAGNYQRAVASFQEALRLRPSQERRLDMARIYGRVDLRDEALELYAEALKQEPKRKDIVLAMADLYYRSSRFESAREYAERYLKSEPQDVGAQKLLARIEEAVGEPGAAGHRWEGALAVRSSGEEYFHLGQVWSKAAETELADRAFKKAADLGYVSPAIWTERALLAWRNGKADEASAACRKALELQPDLPLAKFVLALVAEQSGDEAGALATMRRIADAETKGYIQELAKVFVDARAVPAEEGAKK